jgi:hypothetical protein
MKSRREWLNLRMIKMKLYVFNLYLCYWSSSQCNILLFLSKRSCFLFTNWIVEGDFSKFPIFTSILKMVKIKTKGCVRNMVSAKRNSLVLLAHLYLFAAQRYPIMCTFCLRNPCLEYDVKILPYTPSIVAPPPLMLIQIYPLTLWKTTFFKHSRHVISGYHNSKKGKYINKGIRNAQRVT